MIRFPFQKEFTMLESPKGKIPWQEREKIGNTIAFFMTLFEAYTNPVFYFEKLKIQDQLHDARVLCVLNSLYLAGPLFRKILAVRYFLGVGVILATVPAMLYLCAWIMTKIMLLLGERARFEQSVHILAFSTPAFILAYIPGVGFILAACWFAVLCLIGMIQVFKISILKSFSVLVVVPLLIGAPVGIIRFVEDWDRNHPVVDIEFEAQKVLAWISMASESYAAQHNGLYPINSSELTSPARQYLKNDYCGNTVQHYYIRCEFQHWGYYLEARPLGWQGRGKRTFSVITGGKMKSH